MLTPRPLTRSPIARMTRQSGAAIVEFAIVALVFFTLLIAVMEFGRWMFTLNAATEATRWGARLAAVCDKDDPSIKQKMRFILASVTDAQIAIEYQPAGCDASNCSSVAVGLVNATFTPLIPFMGAAIPLPNFSTSLPRESMASTDNAVCS